MSSRENVLGKISKSKPSVQRPLVRIETNQAANIRDEFIDSIDKVGGKVEFMNAIPDWNKWLKNNFGSALHVYSEIDALHGNFTIDQEINKNQLNSIDVAILEGEFGVSENGAVWLEKFAFRAIPFVTQHLILLLRESSIISNLHEAYAELAEYGMPGFGVFISGPSKTADIEQSLVYGAHGPKTLTVVLV